MFSIWGLQPRKLSPNEEKHSTVAANMYSSVIPTMTSTSAPNS